MRNGVELQLSVILVHHDENERRTLREAFSALHNVNVVGERADLEAGIALARQAVPDVLALELPRAMDATLTAAVEYRLAYPEAAIVFVSDRLDTETVLRALRAGATEVLARPLNPETLHQTFDRIRTQRQHRAFGHQPLERVVRPQRHDATARVTLTHEQLHALTRAVAQVHEGRCGQFGQRKLVGSRSPQPDEFEAAAETTGGVASHQLVGFQRHRQPMCGGTGQPGRRLQVGEVEGACGQRLQDGHAFVDHANRRYTLHIREFYLRM